MQFIFLLHILGHIQYFIQYKDQPFVLRCGANPGKLDSCYLKHFTQINVVLLFMNYLLFSLIIYAMAGDNRKASTKRWVLFYFYSFLNSSTFITKSYRSVTGLVDFLGGRYNGTVRGQSASFG